MRVFVAGATGVMGRSLVPKLIEQGHDVTAMTRQAEPPQWLRELDVKIAVCDVYDVKALEAAMSTAQPDAVIHQLKALPKAINPKNIEHDLAATDRIRTEGTRNLMDAAVKAGVKRFVAQSIAFAYRPEGGAVKTEKDPLWLEAPGAHARTVHAIAELERIVTTSDGLEGVALRYGYFYGPGTAYAAGGSTADMVKSGKFPIAGKGGGCFSFVHVDDAADATILALEENTTGIYNIVDDEPAPLRDWLPVYAEAIGAPQPKRVPVFMARLFAGRYGVYMMTEQRGAFNTKAKQELGWQPKFSSWREGFVSEVRVEA